MRRLLPRPPRPHHHTPNGETKWSTSRLSAEQIHSAPFRRLTEFFIRFVALALVALPMSLGGSPSCFAQDDQNNAATPTLPKVRISRVRRVFHNGEHNAFTDLVRFNGDLYLTFRSCPDGHMVHPTASVIVLRSRDGEAWDQVHQFSIPHRDTRDPHFLVFKNRLFVYTGTWYSGPTTIPIEDYDVNLHLGYGVWTDDGTDWSDPIMLEGTFGHYIWRAESYDGTAYLCGRRKINFDVTARGEPRAMESLMLESSDGLVWKKRGTFQEIAGDETAFVFEDDGAVLGVGRRRSTAELLRSSPPYDHWERVDLGIHLGGPLVAKWGNYRLIGGRRSKAGGPRTALFWLDGSQLVEIAELPSGGDTSYPGFVELSPTKGLLSWYSSHEKDTSGKPITAIYMADLELLSSESP